MSEQSRRKPSEEDNLTLGEERNVMADKLHEFVTGPEEILEYTTKAENGKIVIEINDNDLGRLTIENLETVEKLRESLDKAEEFFIESERRQEEF